MQPFTVILGIILGSVFSVAFGLGTVLLIFALRQSEDPRFADEVPELIRAVAMFSGITVLAAFAFLGSLKAAIWRFLPVTLLVIGLAGVGFYYWPG